MKNLIKNRKDEPFEGIFEHIQDLKFVILDQ